MPPVAQITQITTTNELRRDSTPIFHARASTLGTGPFRDHEFHWTIESAPAGYEYKAREPDYCDSEDLTKGSLLFSGKEHDILVEGVYGVAIQMVDLIPGNYTLRLTVKDGAVPFGFDFDEVTFTVLDPAATTPAETRVVVRADGGGDYTTIQAAIVANVNTENLRIEIAQAGTYAAPTTEVNADGYQLVGTVAGVVIDAEGRVMKCQYQGTRENWVGKGFKRINTSGNPGDPVGIDPGFPAQPRKNFGLVDIELEGANAGDYCSGTFAADTSGGLIRCWSESVDPAYGLCIWTGGVASMQTAFFAIGCRSPKVVGERGLRIKNGISNIVLCRIEGENTTQIRANKESVRYWGVNSEWHTMDRCACPGGIIGGLDTGDGIGQNIRITNTYAKRWKGSGIESTAGSIGFPNFEGAGVYCCVMENEVNNSGFFNPSAEGSALKMCLLINRRIDNVNLVKHSETTGVLSMAGNIMVCPDIVTPIEGFGSAREMIYMDAGTSFESQDNTFPDRATTDNNNKRIDNTTVSDGSWQADPSTSGDLMKAQAIDETGFIAIAPDTCTVPAGVFRDIHGNPLVPGTAGALRGAAQSAPPATAPDLRVTDSSDAVVDHNDELEIPGSLAIGSTQAVQFTLHNDGDDDLAITDTASNGHLTVDTEDNPEGTTIAPAGSATITVLLSTATAGEKLGVLSIVSNDADSPFFVGVSGTVVAQPGSLAVTDADDQDVPKAMLIAMGDELLAESPATVQLTLTNTGELDLAIGEVTPTNNITVDSEDNPADSLIAGGASATITLVLDTATAGAKFGSVVIESDDAENPFIASFKGTVLLSDPNIGDGPGPDLVQRYLSTDETTALVGLHLLSTDIEREAYESLSAADRAVCAVSAADDIDAVLWDGTRQSATQAAQFPRVDHLRGLILPGGEVDVPNELGQESWSVAGIPREIRIAVAIQAAYRAAISIGVVPAPAHDAPPFNRLHPRAQNFARRYLRKVAAFA